MTQRVAAARSFEWVEWAAAAGRTVEVPTAPRASSDRARHGTRGGAAANKLLGSVRALSSAPGLVFPFLRTGYGKKAS